MWNKQTKRNVVVLLTAMMVVALGLTVAAWAKKPVKPPPDPGDTPRFAQVYLGGNAYGINDAGQVVGYVDVTSRAFLLTPEGGEWFKDANGDGINDLMVDLGALGVQERIDENGTVVSTMMMSWGNALNDWGQVVGGSTFDVQTTKGEVLFHALLWDTGNMVDLGTLGGLQCEALSINDSGQVVGWSRLADWEYSGRGFLVAPEDSDNDGDPDTWFRDDDGNGINDLMIDLGTLGGSICHAEAINDSGQVVGWAETSVYDVMHAFLITPEYDNDGNPVVWFRDDDLDGANDLMIDLGTPGGLESWARAINDSGQIVGYGLNGRGDCRAFLLTPEGSEWFKDDNGDGANDLMTDLGVFKKFDGSGAYDLNNDAQVIGSSWDKIGRRVVHKSILWENGEMLDLDTMTDSSTDIGSDIRGINNAGEIVTGSGYILLPIPAP